MFLSSLRKAIRERKQAEADRDLYKDRLEDAEHEVRRLQEKLEERTDFFMEREFKIFDRFFTSERKTYAITDEIRRKQLDETFEKEASGAALTAYLADKKEFLEQCAREAGFPDWKDKADRTFQENYGQYVTEFQQGA
jgi:hypothetical protein